MSVFGTDLRYGSVAQVFHWLTAVLVLSTWLVSGGRDLMMLHQTLGMAVFAVVVLRLVWRAVDRRPGEVATPRAMAFAAQAVHWLLYLPSSAPLSPHVARGPRGHGLRSRRHRSVAGNVARPRPHAA